MKKMLDKYENTRIHTEHEYDSTKYVLMQFDGLSRPDIQHYANVTVHSDGARPVYPFVHQAVVGEARRNSNSSLS